MAGFCATCIRDGSEVTLIPMLFDGKLVSLCESCGGQPTGKVRRPRRTISAHIVNALRSMGEATPGAIAARLGLDDAQARNNLQAALCRLRQTGEVEPVGKVARGGASANNLYRLRSA